MSTLALAIQTIPDSDTGRRLHNIENLSDRGVVKAMFHLQQQRTGSEELPLYLQQIVSIALTQEKDGQLHTEMLSNPYNERQLLQHYVNATQDCQQITWQGSTYDFPILRYRALKHGIKLAQADDAAAQVDLSQHFAAPNSLAMASLADISCLLDLPPLATLSKTDCWQAYLSEDYACIDHANRIASANIFRIYQALS